MLFDELRRSDQNCGMSVQQFPNSGVTVENSPDHSAPPALTTRRRSRPWWVRYSLLAVFLYACWCTMLYYLQDRMLFPRDVAPTPPPHLYDHTTQELQLDLEDGGKVAAFFLPAIPVDKNRPAPLVVYFHGNAEIIDYQHTTIQGYRKLGCAVLLPEFRGYGRAAGHPSEAAIIGDAEHFYGLVLQRSDVDAARVVFHGRSLGGGPAAGLAATTKRPPTALILESTFISVPAMARQYWVPSFLVKNKFQVDRALDKLDIPALLFHGTHDDIIPVAHGRALRDLARRGKYVEYDCRHNDFPGDANEEAYWQEIAQFLRGHQIIPAAGGGK